MNLGTVGEGRIQPLTLNRSLARLNLETVSAGKGKGLRLGGRGGRGEGKGRVIGRKGEMECVQCHWERRGGGIARPGHRDMVMRSSLEGGRDVTWPELRAGHVLPLPGNGDNAYCSSPLLSGRAVRPLSLNPSPLPP